ncbi:MAG: tetratricopeptide repeat protein [Candidatus Thorarchaeota archaeon]
MSHDGQTTETLLSKARSLRRQGQNKKAIEAYREVLSKTPENLDALNEMGQAQIRVGEQTEAIVAFDLAISFLPTDFRASTMHLKMPNYGPRKPELLKAC